MLRVELQTARAGLDLALEVADGECLALAGPSGAGKTTVLQAVAGLFRPERGLVTCGDAVWLDTAARRSTSRPSAGAAATSSRTTRCSGT